MNIKAFINHIKKTRPVYADWLIWFDKKISRWQKGMPKITIVPPCPNCNHGGAKLTHYKWFKTPGHSWIKNVWVHHGCKDSDQLLTGPSKV